MHGARRRGVALWEKSRSLALLGMTNQEFGRQVFGLAGRLPSFVGASPFLRQGTREDGPYNGCRAFGRRAGWRDWLLADYGGFG
jgi:hypothetical protein